MKNLDLPRAQRTASLLVLAGRLLSYDGGETFNCREHSPMMSFAPRLRPIAQLGKTVETRPGRSDNNGGKLRSKLENECLKGEVDPGSPLLGELLEPSRPMV